MRAAFYDTETTGMPLWGEPSEDPRQPHIVQIAALLVDLDTWATVASIDLTIAPTDWEIPADVVAIHGITTEHARAVGVSETLALELFCQLWARAQVRVAHNESFDARIIRCALHRFAGDAGLPGPEHWKAGIAECTQLMSTPILKLPATDKMRRAGMGSRVKSANLREAYRHFMGTELVGAHSAMADAQGCRDVYKAIRSRAA